MLRPFLVHVFVRRAHAVEQCAQVCRIGFDVCLARLVAERGNMCIAVAFVYGFLRVCVCNSSCACACACVWAGAASHVPYLSLCVLLCSCSV